MAKQVIEGTDTLNQGRQKINSNFDELYLTQEQQAGDISDLATGLSNLNTKVDELTIEVVNVNDNVGTNVTELESTDVLIPDFNLFDVFSIQNQQQALTINLAPPQTKLRYFNRKLIRIKADGQYPITFNANYKPVGVTLPAQTEGAKWVYIDMIAAKYSISVLGVYTETGVDSTPVKLSNGRILDSFPDRIYFDSERVITGTNFNGLVLASPAKNVVSLVINPGQLSNHYVVVDSPYAYGEAPTSAYAGGSDIQDGNGNLVETWTTRLLNNSLSPSDLVAPVLSNFIINSANPDRVYFNSSEPIVGSNFIGFSIQNPAKTITAISIVPGEETGHYFTVSSPFGPADLPTIAYTGGSDIEDAYNNSLANFSAVSINNQITFSYTPLPEPPAIVTASKLIDSSMGSSISTTELGTSSGNQVKMGLVPDTHFNTLRASGLVGTEQAPFIFRPNSLTGYATIDGSALASGSNLLGQTATPVSDWVQFHKLRVVGRADVNSMTGFKWAGKAGGSNVLVSDCIFDLTQSPGMQVNGDGDAGTYGKIHFKFCRVFGSNVPNEAIYAGDTSLAGFGVIDETLIENCFATQKGWDGFQMNSTRRITLRKSTAYDIANLYAESGQKSLLQAQNVGDGSLIEDCMFWSAPRAFQIAARDIIIRNCVFYSDEEGFLQDLVRQAGYTDPLATYGGTIMFDSCFFFSRIPRLNAMSVNEDGAFIVFKNCAIDSNITQLYTDSRVDKTTFSITVTGGVQVVTPVTPTFNSLSSLDPESGLVQESFYKSLRMGYRL